MSNSLSIFKSPELYPTLKIGFRISIEQQMGEIQTLFESEGYLIFDFGRILCIKGSKHCPSSDWQSKNYVQHFIKSLGRKLRESKKIWSHSRMCALTKRYKILPFGYYFNEGYQFAPVKKRWRKVEGKVKIYGDGLETWSFRTCLSSAERFV